MFGQPLPHPPLPGPGELGPDPEPLGTERFERLMQGAFPPRVEPPVTLEGRRRLHVSAGGESHRRRRQAA
jgi:hypothetical protein